MGLRDKVALCCVVLLLYETCISCMPRCPRKSPFDYNLKSFNDDPFENDENYRDPFFYNSHFSENLNSDTSSRLPFSSKYSEFYPKKQSQIDVVKDSVVINNLRKEIRQKRKNNQYQTENFPITQNNEHSVFVTEIGEFPETQYPLTASDTWGNNFWNPLPFNKDDPFYKTDDVFNPKKRQSSQTYLKPSSMVGNKGMFALVSSKTKENPAYISKFAKEVREEIKSAALKMMPVYQTTTNDTSIVEENETSNAKPESENTVIDSDLNQNIDSPEVIDEMVLDENIFPDILLYDTIADILPVSEDDFTIDYDVNEDGNITYLRIEFPVTNEEPLNVSSFEDNASELMNQDTSPIDIIENNNNSSESITNGSEVEDNCDLLLLDNVNTTECLDSITYKTKLLSNSDDVIDKDMILEVLTDLILKSVNEKSLKATQMKSKGDSVIENTLVTNPAEEIITSAFSSDNKSDIPNHAEYFNSDYTALNNNVESTKEDFVSEDEIIENTESVTNLSENLRNDKATDNNISITNGTRENEAQDRKLSSDDNINQDNLSPTVLSEIKGENEKQSDLLNTTDKSTIFSEVEDIENEHQESELFDMADVSDKDIENKQQQSDLLHTVDLSNDVEVLSKHPEEYLSIVKDKTPEKYKLEPSLENEMISELKANDTVEELAYDKLQTNSTDKKDNSIELLQEDIETFNTKEKMEHDALSLESFHDEPPIETVLIEVPEGLSEGILSGTPTDIFGDNLPEDFALDPKINATEAITDSKETWAENSLSDLLENKDDTLNTAEELKTIMNTSIIERQYTESNIETEPKGKSNDSREEILAENKSNDLPDDYFKNDESPKPTIDTLDLQEPHNKTNTDNESLELFAVLNEEVLPEKPSNILNDSSSENNATDLEGNVETLSSEALYDEFVIDSEPVERSTDVNEEVLAPLNDSFTYNTTDACVNDTEKYSIDLFTNNNDYLLEGNLPENVASEDNLPTDNSNIILEEVITKSISEENNFEIPDQTNNQTDFSSIESKSALEEKIFNSENDNFEISDQNNILSDFGSIELLIDFKSDTILNSTNITSEEIVKELSSESALDSNQTKEIIEELSSIESDSQSEEITTNTIKYENLNPSIDEPLIIDLLSDSYYTTDAPYFDDFTDSPYSISEENINDTSNKAIKNIPLLQDILDILNYEELLIEKVLLPNDKSLDKTIESKDWIEQKDFLSNENNSNSIETVS